MTDGAVFFKAEHPGMTHIRVTLQGGEGGPGSDGTPGSPGQVATRVLTAAELTEAVPVQVGRGGAPDALPGVCLVSIYDCSCEPPQ